MKKPTSNVALVAGTLTTSLATFSNAAPVQITLLGNRLSTAANTLNADITGDGVDDLNFSSTIRVASGVRVSISQSGIFAGISNNTSYRLAAFFAVGGVGTGVAYGGTTPQNINYLNPIIFTDVRINSGSATQAWLQVNAFNSSLTNHTVALTRVIFDDTSVTRPSYAVIPGTQTEWSAIPEPSSLALLALGAGGLLMRRKRNAA